ncbi:MAG: hypothetical protein MMC33_010854, partial [Icmadophila ericetorum]|nr:hypothetical protein [Icmadophila ericetorum]
GRTGGSGKSGSLGRDGETGESGGGGKSGETGKTGRNGSLGRDGMTEESGGDGKSGATGKTDRNGILGRDREEWWGWQEWRDRQDRQGWQGWHGLGEWWGWQEQQGSGLGVGFARSVGFVGLQLTMMKHCDMQMQVPHDAQDGNGNLPLNTFLFHGPRAPGLSDGVQTTPNAIQIKIPAKARKLTKATLITKHRKTNVKTVAQVAAEPETLTPDEALARMKEDPEYVIKHYDKEWTIDYIQCNLQPAVINLLSHVIWTHSYTDLELLPEAASEAASRDDPTIESRHHDETPSHSKVSSSQHNRHSHQT